MRDPDTQVVAQANWATGATTTNGCGLSSQQQRLRIRRRARQRHRRARAAVREPLPAQAAPPPPSRGRRSRIDLRGRTIELLATPGGETTDSMVVWLPDHRVSSAATFGPLFGHMPNLVTMRGDRYRDAQPTIASIELVRALRPESCSPATSIRSRAPSASTPTYPPARRGRLRP